MKPKKEQLNYLKKKNEAPKEEEKKDWRKGVNNFLDK